jgi:hypothetical protein
MYTYPDPLQRGHLIKSWCLKLNGIQAAQVKIFGTNPDPEQLLHVFFKYMGVLLGKGAASFPPLAG